MENKPLNKNLKLLFKSSLIVFVGMFLSKLLSYFYRIIIARHFGPEMYGVFSLSVMIFGVFLSFSLMGLSEGLLRYIPFFRGKNKKENISYLFHFSAYVTIFSSILFGIILFFSSSYISNNIFHTEMLTIFLKIFSFLIIFNVLANLLLISIKSFEKIKIYSFSMNFLSNFIKVFFLIIFIFLGLGSESISSSYFLGIFVMFLFSFFYCKYKLPELFIKTSLKKKDKKILRKDLLIYSVPLMFYVFIAMVFYWTDSFFIGFFKSPLEVGIYNAAIPISLLLTFVPELFMQLFFPMITKEFSKKNLKLIRELSKQVNKWILLVNLPLFMLLLSFPKLILNILFGSEYLVAQTSLQILLFGQFFFSMSIISQNLILMKGKSKLILFDFCLISFLNIILNYFLIPMEKIWFIDNSFGINGAALSTAFSLICLNVIFSLQTKKYLLIIPLRKKMFNLALSALISFMILLYLKTLVSETIISTILISISFVLFYALFLFLFKALDKNDLMIIQAIKRNFVTYNI